MWYSHRLGEITDEHIQAALDRFALGALIHTAPVPFGLFGQNLFISATSGEYVLRGAPHYPWQLPTERHFAEVIARETSVPVPWPYWQSSDSGPFPWPWGYAIMPRLPGLLLADGGVYGALTAEQRVAMARAEGVLLWALQQAGSPVAGEFDPGTHAIRPFAGGYVNRTVNRVLANAGAAFANGGHSEADHAWLRSLVEPWRELPPPRSYTVVHEDFSRNNMVAAIDGDRVTITGVFDLMTCHYGDGLADLARQFSILLSEPEGERHAREYVGAYVARRGPLDRNERQRTLLYLADERMLAWEYARRPGHENLGWWDLSIPLRTWLTPFFETWTRMIDDGQPEAGAWPMPERTDTTAHLIETIANRTGADRTAITPVAWRDGRVICRVARPNGDLVAKASVDAGAFDEEVAAIRTLAELGLPVSEVVTVEAGPPALFIATWTEGKAIDAGSDPAVLREVGGILSRIHAVPAGPPYSANPSVAWWIQGWYNTVSEWWASTWEADGSMLAASRAWMEAVRPVLERQPGCLMLFDGRPDHFLVDDQSRLRMIDVADLQPGTAAMDLAVLELGAPGVLPHLLAGYEPTPAERAAFEVLVPFLAFLRALASAEWHERVLGDAVGTRFMLDAAREAMERWIARESNPAAGG